MPFLFGTNYAQKYCIRKIFGATEAYLEKHRTAARTQSIDSQKLGPEFFQLEHTQLLFNSHGIFTVHNLYNYHTFTFCKQTTEVSYTNFFL